ncbi:MAG: DoxX family protein [Alsobacter sp.]
MSRVPVLATPRRSAEQNAAGLASVIDTVGRMLIAGLFVYSGWFDMATHWPDAVDVVAGRGLPLPSVVAGAAMTFEIAAPILLFVPRTRAFATAALAAYCVATALLFHTDWLLNGVDVTDAGFHFFKNLALAGALLTSLAGELASQGRSG